MFIVIFVIVRRYAISDYPTKLVMMGTGNNAALYLGGPGFSSQPLEISYNE
jgi:hypothetical protein